ncbi:hypothetical protein M9H77_27555 [Catharanthus roseus]|uniref:Uncharacterized protein n=1 Tax=Catharanthus roseus TaxID=4058 RepID=A0ACC0AEA4_CATRO|nr:hypothetical protein M9H77_27555 [Catharanthus roseus]
MSSLMIMSKVLLTFVASSMSSRSNSQATISNRICGPVRILNLWMGAGEKPRHIIICAPRWRYSRDTGPCRRKQMRWGLQPKCFYEHILYHVHPVICWPAVLLRTNRMSLH